MEPLPFEARRWCVGWIGQYLHRAWEESALPWRGERDKCEPLLGYRWTGWCRVCRRIFSSEWARSHQYGEEADECHSCVLLSFLAAF